MRVMFVCVRACVRMCVCVCVCVCVLSVRDHNFGTIRPKKTVRSWPNFLVHACYLWPWLCPPLAADVAYFQFMDDVISAHKPRLLDVAAPLRRSSHAALGLAINGAQEYPLQTTDARDYFSQSG